MQAGHINVCSFSSEPVFSLIHFSKGKINTNKYVPVIYTSVVCNVYTKCVQLCFTAILHGKMFVELFCPSAYHNVYLVFHEAVKLFDLWNC